MEFNSIEAILTTVLRSNNVKDIYVNLERSAMSNELILNLHSTINARKTLEIKYFNAGEQELIAHIAAVLRETANSLMVMASDVAVEAQKLAMPH